MIDEYKYSYYNTLRTEARRCVVDAINKQIKAHGNHKAWRGITLGSINDDAIEYARREWPKHYSADTHDGLPHSWERLYHKFSPNPAHFNLAVWQETENGLNLQGLAIGKPSKGRSHLVINWIERSYEPTYLPGGVLLPILDCGEQYAKLLGCDRLLIKDAVDPSQFAEYGYAPYKLRATKGSYIAKELDHG